PCHLSALPFSNLCRSRPSTLSLHDALPISFRHVFEGAISLLVIKTVPVVWSGLLRGGAFGRGILEGCAVDHKNVQATVVIVIEKGDAAAHGLHQIMHGGVRREVIEVDSESGGTVSEPSGKWLLPASRGTRSPDNGSPHE